MADIFISYAREDRAIAERLASAIEASGKTVWWDRHIKGGAQFSKDIERELKAAAHVLVLWSAASVESRWVRDEATEAADNGRLVGATIDGTMAPLGFRQFHTVDLQDWTRTGTDLPHDLADAFGGERAAPTTSAPPVAKARSKKPLIIASAAIAIALAGGAYVATQGLPGTEAEQAANVSLAVMPFETLGNDDIAFLGTGLSGAINNALTSLPGVSLIANSSASALADNGLTANELGQELGVTHLVEGQITPQGDELRVEVSLIDAATGRQLWTKSYNEARDATPLLTNQIARDLALTMQSRLGVGQGTLGQAGTDDPRAHEAYLRGIEALSARYQAENRLEGYNQFRLAVQRDPGFADAHAGLAYMLVLSRPDALQMSEEARIEEVDATLERALQLDPDNLLARSARAHHLFLIDGDIEASLALTEEILSEAPDFGPAHYARAGALEVTQDYRDGSRHMLQALERDPFNQTLQNAYASSLIGLGNYNQLRAYITSCGACPQIRGSWPAGLGLIGNEAEFERDWEDLKRHDMRAGVPGPMIDALRPVISGVIRGEPFEIPPFLRQNVDLNLVNLTAASGRYQDALDLLAPALADTYPTSAHALGNVPRTEMPEAVRADPRYHAAFDNPAAQRIAAYRREQGRTRGLPVFPVKPYEGP